MGWRGISLTHTISQQMSGGASSPMITPSGPAYLHPATKTSFTMPPRVCSPLLRAIAKEGWGHPCTALRHQHVPRQQPRAGKVQMAFGGNVSHGHVHLLLQDRGPRHDPYWEHRWDFMISGGRVGSSHQATPLPLSATCLHIIVAPNTGGHVAGGPECLPPFHAACGIWLPTSWLL